jgi:hypothetical protein
MNQIISTILLIPLVVMEMLCLLYLIKIAFLSFRYKLDYRFNYHSRFGLKETLRLIW